MPTSSGKQSSSPFLGPPKSRHQSWIKCASDLLGKLPERQKGGGGGGRRGRLQTKVQVLGRREGLEMKRLRLWCSAKKVFRRLFVRSPGAQASSQKKARSLRNDLPLVSLLCPVIRSSQREGQPSWQTQQRDGRVRQLGPGSVMFPSGGDVRGALSWPVKDCENSDSREII